MKRHVGLGLLALIATAAVAGYTLQRPIGELLFERAIERRIGADVSRELPDGLHAFVCGSGAPLTDKDRAGPCIAVLAGQHGFVFDSGSGSVRKLGAMAFPMNKLEAAFITHLHSDHIDGIGELLLQAWMAGGRASPLPIYGPAGIERVVDGIEQAYTIDRGFRIAHHGAEVARPGGFGGSAHIIPAEKLGDRGAIVYRNDGVTVRAVSIRHAPVSPAFGYRIDYGGRSIVISGDTAYSRSLEQMARGADVVFHEALNPQMVASMGKQLRRRGLTDAARIMDDIPSYHSSPEDAARLAKNAGAKDLVLYHLIPAVPAGYMQRAFIGDAPSIFDGAIIVSRDGLLVGLPAKSGRIDIDQLL